jgi:hypothetical protein
VIALYVIGMEIVLWASASVTMDGKGHTVTLP